MHTSFFANSTKPAFRARVLAAMAAMIVLFQFGAPARPGGPSGQYRPRLLEVVPATDRDRDRAAAQASLAEGERLRKSKNYGEATKRHGNAPELFRRSTDSERAGLSADLLGVVAAALETR